MNIDKNNLVWIDSEMTGLDPLCDAILEIATVVTDCQLREMSLGPVFAIHQPERVLAKMDEWNVRHHGSSGLLQRVRASAVNYAQAEQETLAFLKLYAVPGMSPMCGNSVCQDRRFLVRLMPQLHDFFHYRHIDVSSIKELAKRWSPQTYAGFQKPSAHIAKDDIIASIEELRYYRERLMKC